MDACFAALAAEWPTIDFLVHAIGFSDKNELRGRYVDTSLDNFLLTMNVSASTASPPWPSACAAMMPDGGAC
jgi:enoyl-[acyl-carrier protein] reductase I